MENELEHWGTKGMRWGIRRYQNKDGTLTPAGRKRYQKELAKLKEKEKIIKNRQKSQAKFDELNRKRKQLDDLKKGKVPSTTKKSEEAPKRKSIKDMSDEELQAFINRTNLEKQYKEALAYQNKATISRGQKFAQTLMNDVVAPVSKEVGKAVLKRIMTNAVNKAFDAAGKGKDEGQNQDKNKDKKDKNEGQNQDQNKDKKDK